MHRDMRAVVLVACLFVLLGAPAARATSYEWDADANPVNGANGGTGTWNTALANWYDGVSADVAWPNTQSPRVDAVIGGTFGPWTVTTGANLYAGALNFETASYTLVLVGANQLHIMSLGGSQLSGTTLKGNSSNNRLWFDDASNPVTFNGILDLSGTSGLQKEGAGTLVLNPASVSGSNGIGIYAGTVLLNGSAASIVTGSISVKDGSTTRSVLGGTGNYTVLFVQVNARGDIAGTTLAGVLAPGDPASNSGIGTLTVAPTGGEPTVRFNGANQADCASIFRVQLASPTSYDKLVVNKGNPGINGGVRLNQGTKTFGAILDLTVFPTFSGGSVGNFMKLIDVTSTTETLTGQFQNVANNSYQVFTNSSGAGYRFQYKYPYDTSGTQNDFGLLIDEIVTADAGGAYSIDAGGEALSGSIAGGTGAAWAWDFDDNGTVDKTGQNPFVDLAYFTGTFGWAEGSTHTIKLTVTDLNGVVAWDTTDLTLEAGAIPEPGTWALMGTGVLLGIGFLRRRRIK